MLVLRVALRRAPHAVQRPCALASGRTFSLTASALAAASSPSYAAQARPSALSLAFKLRRRKRARTPAVQEATTHAPTSTPLPTPAPADPTSPAVQAAGAAQLGYGGIARLSRTADFAATPALRIPIQGLVDKVEHNEAQKESRRKNRRKKSARQKALTLERLADKETAEGGSADTSVQAKGPRPHDEPILDEKDVKAVNSLPSQAFAVPHASISPPPPTVRSKIEEIMSIKSLIRRTQAIRQPWDRLAPKQQNTALFKYRQRFFPHNPVAPTDDSSTADALSKPAVSHAEVRKRCSAEWPEELIRLGKREQELEAALFQARKELSALRNRTQDSNSRSQDNRPTLMKQIAETLPLPTEGAQSAGREAVPSKSAGEPTGQERRSFGRIKPVERRRWTPEGGRAAGSASNEGRYTGHPALHDGASDTTERPPARELSSYQHVLSASNIPFTPRPSPLGDVPVATLAHSLDRVLFNPGVHFLRDPRTGVYNFARDVLENVPKINEFDFGKLPQYITSSKDEVLKGLLEQEGRTFAGSTSSTIGMLCQIYFWLSKGKPINTRMLSADFHDASKDFSMGQQLPASVVLRHNDGRYSIDADKSFDAAIETNVLAHYGHLMEKLLTTEASEFKRFLHDSEDPAPSEADHHQAYHYGMTEHMVLRSQLDAHNQYLPNKTFDLKTRGTVAIRQDRLNYEESAGYVIDKLRGPWESFEREYYDLIRSAFLKYQFQARIGCMDGIFVAYHSTARFYGFQYVPISEMDDALFGNSKTGDEVFRLSLGALETILRRATECYPGESVNATFAVDHGQDLLRVFVARQSDLETVERGIKADEPAAEGDEQPQKPREPIDVQSAPIPMTLLEVRGTSYLDGEAQDQPVTLPAAPAASDSNADAVHPGARKTWQLAFDITASSTESPEGQDRVAPGEIVRLFARTRDHQRMFSNLYLPTGVSPAEVREAQRRAHDAGVELDESDLALRFPLAEGLEYTAPSRGVKALRRRAREGEERRKVEEERRRGEKVVEVVSRVVEHEELLE